VQEAPVRPKIEEANKSKMFWDGFQWVSKANAAAAAADPAMQNQTKKMRRLVISNLPLHLGLGEREIGEFVTKFIIENYLNDDGNFQPVREVVVDSTRNSATIELSSVEEASRLAKVESIKVLGSNCRVSKVSESKFGATTNVATLVVEAQRTAQAQAAALAAMSMLQKKDGSTSFTLSKVNVLGTASKILKVTNLIDSQAATADQQLNELLSDIGEEFGKIGKITDKFIVKSGKAIPGAEAGTVFITFENENLAEKAMNAMANKRYEGREIRVIFVDEETFQKSFAQLKN